MSGLQSDPLRGLGRARARRIRAAVFRGEAVRDPRDAGYAVLLARQVLKLDRPFVRRRWLAVHAVLLVVFLAYVRSPKEAALVALPLMLVAIGRLIQRRTVANARRSLELNEQLAVAFAVAIPELPDKASLVPPIRSKAGAIAMATAIVAVALLVAIAVVTRSREVVGEHRPSTWASNANAACADMVDEYRRANVRLASAHAADPMYSASTEPPLHGLAEIRRAGVRIEQTAATKIQQRIAPSGAPAAAVDAFERKIQLEWDAIRAAERGDRAAFEQAMLASVALGIEARDAFTSAGARVCASLM